jgi:predicted GIY-YIG superfamily endonuclease
MTSFTEFYVYLLRCSDGTYYVGHTDNIEARIAAHHAGAFPGYTAGRRPVQLLWLDTVPSRDDAFRRERQLKGWSRAKKEALIRGDWERLAGLARSHPTLVDPAPAHPEPVEGRAGAAPRSAVRNGLA